MQDHQLVRLVFKRLQLAARIWHWNRTSRMSGELQASDRVLLIWICLRRILWIVKCSYTDMCHLTMGTRSEKCAVWRFRHSANIIQFMCIRKAIEPHSSSRLVICRIYWLLAQICVVDDTFIACQNVPKSCVLVLVLLQHTTSRHVEYTQNLSSTEAVRTIYPLLTRPCAMLISRHCPCLRLIQFIRANSMEKSPCWKANSSSASQKFPAFPGTLRFISAFTTARHLFLSWTRSIHSMPPRFKSWRSTLVLSYLSIGFPSGLFLSGLFTKTLYTPIMYPIRATCPAYAILLDFITWIISGEEYRS